MFHEYTCTYLVFEMSFNTTPLDDSGKDAYEEK